MVLESEAQAGETKGPRFGSSPQRAWQFWVLKEEYRILDSAWEASAIRVGFPRKPPLVASAPEFLDFSRKVLPVKISKKTGE
jgi:hypothetical protein